MPAATTRWQSSQRPLFVRTVWVDGRRHAILSRDDPALQYPRPASSPPSDVCSRNDSCCHLEDCLIKLRLALQPDTYQGRFQDSIFPIRQGTVESSTCYDHEDSDSFYSDDLPQLRLPLLGQYPKVYSFDRVDPPFLPDLQLNPLSERVLQWLDLSGKGKRLNSAILTQKEVESSRERRKNLSTDTRKAHISRRRELPTRSLSVDVLANMKLSARGIDTQVKQRKPHAEVVTMPKSSDHEECQPKRSVEEAPLIQNFQPPRLLRPMGGWSSPRTPNRPQLHIFMPPLDEGVKLEDNSEGESVIGESN